MMKKHYLLIDGKSYRTEVNMRTAEAWERLSGLKIGQFEMQAAMSAKKGGVPTKTMVYWLYCSLVEGEDIEGREFPYGLEDLKKVIKPSILTEYAPIFLDCYIGQSSVSSEEKAGKEQKKSLLKQSPSEFRSFFRSPWVRLAGLLILISLAVLLIYSQH